MSKFYITSAIPYVNAAPHIGHALEFVQTDVIARYHRAILHDAVHMLCGGDENALKNVQAAEKAELPIQQFVDENTQKFLDLSQKLNCQYDVWQKGSDQKTHFPSSQKLWTLCQKDIYEKEYTGLYCVGCEAFYTPDELNENGECFEHPGKKLDKVTEKNYFFRLNAYQKQIKQLITSDQLKITPEKRKNEVLAFLENGLQDISISRSNERARNWGVPVPNDPTQRMYVWFDALNIYQSGIGFGWNDEEYKKWWPADVHVIGKGILRFHAVYWPAFLLSAGLVPPKELFVHEYFTVNGQKMSKTLGNVIDPFTLIEKYGTDALRYYFLAQFSPFNDGDFSEDKFKKIYNADLANGLGNLIARVARLCDKVTITINAPPTVDDTYKQTIENYQFNETLTSIWEEIRILDKKINDAEPWKITDTKQLTAVLQDAVDTIRKIAYALQPFLPQTAEKILHQFSTEHIASQSPLFPRLV